jgi:ribose/xylose/arabinose/galactoside ABC-type transport system permease subunit
MRRVLIWTAIGAPVGATFFGLLVFIAAAASDVPGGVPVAMGAVVGVLAGVFFGMWTGVVVSVDETEHANLVLRQRPNV